MVEIAISLEIVGKTHRARVYDKDDEGSGGATSTSYYLKYKKKANSRGRKKANGWVDLDLPTGEKCSWWRLDGYATCAEPVNYLRRVKNLVQSLKIWS